MRKAKILTITILILIFLSFGFITIINQLVIPGLFIGYEIYVQDDIAYVSKNEGIEIINVENPIHPRIESTIQIFDGAFSSIKENNILYIAGDSSGFVIANVSDSKAPIIFSTTPLQGSAIGITYSNSIAYVISSAVKVQIFDVSNPYSPFLMSTFSTTQAIDYRDVIVDDDLMYLADSSKGIEVINVSDPINPVFLRRISSPAIDLYKYQDFLFLASHWMGVKVYNVSNPLSATLKKSFQEPEGEAWGVWGNYSHLYVSDLQKGVYLIDINTEELPQKVSHFTNAAPHSIQGNNNLIYIGDQDRRIIILDSNLNALYKGHKLNLNYDFPILLSLGSLIIFLYLRLRKKRSFQFKTNGL